jgi:hypothetical protein
MAISGNDRATTTSRAGVAIAGQTRCGFTPKDLDTDGTYVWDNEDGTTSNQTSTVWTEEKR